MGSSILPGPVNNLISGESHRETPIAVLLPRPFVWLRFRWHVRGFYLGESYGFEGITASYPRTQTVLGITLGS